MSTTQPHDTDPQIPVVRPRVDASRLGVPWGLFVALGLYALAVVGYVWASYWRTADYQSAAHYAKAWEVLGRDEGTSSTRQELTVAYAHLLEAARLKPEVRSYHDQLQRLNWRFDERGWKVPEDQRHASEAVAGLWQRIQQERRPVLVVGVRDRGWAPDQLVEGPRRIFRWSPIGGLLIVGIWAYGRFNGRRVREQEKEAELQSVERELEERQRARERMTREHVAQPRRRKP
jgi:hypothetical protein